MIYHGTFEQRVGAGGAGDAECVLGEGVQDSTGVSKEFEGLITDVGNGGGDFQVRHSVNLEVGGRALEGQAGSGSSGCRGGDEGDE